MPQTFVVVLSGWHVVLLINCLSQLSIYSVNIAELITGLENVVSKKFSVSLLFFLNLIEGCQYLTRIISGIRTAISTVMIMNTWTFGSLLFFSLLFPLDRNFQNVACKTRKYDQLYSKQVTVKVQSFCPHSKIRWREGAHRLSGYRKLF